MPQIHSETPIPQYASVPSRAPTPQPHPNPEPPPSLLTLHPTVAALYPGAGMGLLRMHTVQPRAPYPAQEAQATLAALQARYGALPREARRELPAAHANQRYVKRFGQGYPVLAQLNSVLEGQKAIPLEQPLLAALFFTEMETLLLMAGHDCAALRLPLCLTVADGEDAYESLTGRDTFTRAGDLTLRDGAGIISSAVRGPDRRTRLTETTTEVLFTVYAPPGITPEAVAVALAALERRVQGFSPEAVTVFRGLLWTNVQLPAATL